MTSRADLLRLARTRRAAPVLTGVAAVALVSAVLGGWLVPVPSFGAGTETRGVPFRTELPLLAAVFLAAAFSGPMDDFEALAGARFARVRRGYGAALTALACAFSFVTESVAAGPGAGVVFVRSLLLWLGLALLSRRLLGQHLAWALPVASALPLVWFSSGTEWWDWTWAPAGSPVGWGMAAAALLAGTAAAAATRWRLRGCPPVRRRSRGSRA
ncbi:hypothetical protein [Streptomyces sp. NPDC048172]|uniref:hypothetical protein n=1 Tax=Streptomyces sp. NPDC048172 TaxID=3365505 RepID=UPI0037168C0C